MGRSAPSAAEIVAELEENGAVCLPSFFEPSFADDMRREAHALLSAPPDHKTTFRTEQPSGRLIWVHPEVLQVPRFPSLGRAFNSDLFRDIATGYDPKCDFFRNATITYDHRPCKITDTHFDTLGSLKFMIYLGDVDQDNAAFRYCLGSHRKNRKLRNLYRLMGGKVEEIPNIPAPDEHIALTDLEGPAGTLVVFDTDGFHAAGSLKEGKERLLIRSRTALSGWLDNRILQQVTRQNPLRVFAPWIVPKGRQATRGFTRATAADQQQR
jgi:Phytanoyl-CoA dioxygenase (PhyH)